MGKRQLIISVSREYGSGGHQIADELAHRLGIKLVDRNFLHDLAKEKGLDVNELEKYDEKPIKMFMSRTVRNYSNSIEENIARLEFRYIKEMADRGESFVIVGRCAENVLKDNPSMISIFVLGDMEAKISRVMRVFAIDSDKAKDKIKRHDKSRKAYHNNHCPGKWGDSRNYHICINSSKLSLQDNVDVLMNYINARAK